MKIQVIPEAIEVCLTALKDSKKALIKKMPLVVITEKQERYYEKCEAMQIGLEYGIRLFEKIQKLVEVEFEK